MKWLLKQTAPILTLAIIGLCATDALAERVDPWAFSNIVVVTVPGDVKVERQPDNKGVVLFFPSWNSTIHKSIKRALAGSPLAFKLHPARQAEMTVEIFSFNANVDYGFKNIGRKTQIIVGELRPEWVLYDFLNGSILVTPLSKPVRELLQKGQISAARFELEGEALAAARDAAKKKETALTKGLKTRPGVIDFLSKARISVLKAQLRGKRMAKCPKIPEEIVGLDEREGAILVAFCQFRSGNHKEAFEALQILEDSRFLLKDDGTQYRSKKDSLDERADNLTRLIVATQILSSSRADMPIHVTATAMGHKGRSADNLVEDVASFGAFFVEVIKDAMVETGFAYQFSTMTKAVMAQATELEIIKLAPSAAEAYFSDAQYVRASDISSFFLSKRLPNWIAGRLKRVRGLCALQEGDWAGAIKDLSVVSEKLPNWELEDKLALIEARLSAGMPISKLERSLKPLIKTRNTKMSASMGKWLARLWGEIELRQGRLPVDDILDEMPGYVLYQAASKADSVGAKKTRDELNRRLREGNSGWSELTRLDEEIAGYKTQLKEITTAMEEMEEKNE